MAKIKRLGTSSASAQTVDTDQGPFQLEGADPNSGDAFEIAWVAVQSLIDKFDANKPYYFSKKYQEANARQDFIDVLFTCLGWDVRHDHQHDPYKQEVRIETPEQKAKGRADYSFSIAPHFRRIRFFVEAKRPQSNIATPDNCFQAIKYSWPKGLPITVLTDFHSLHIIDSRFRPKVDSVTSRVVRSWTYSDFRVHDKFAELYYLLSREAVADGSIQIFSDNELPEIQTATRQYSLFAAETKEFDDDFLDTMDEWREILAVEFKRANNDLNGEQLTECVQRTLDRLVFIRFLEDKGIEPDSIIDKLGTRRRGYWEDFVATCARLDATYNGIVFKQHSVLDSAGFAPTGSAFSEICDELTDYHSPYDFASIPVEILGRIYERFLGRIVLADNGDVRIEEKPNVRRAGGVYYTPDYIVNYMVDQALGPQVNGKKPAEVLAVRAIDTSCGSGSFLIAIYDCLVRAISAYYRKFPKTAKKGTLENRDGLDCLSLSFKREILIKCIFGVDIDSQAVEVAQLSLYLKLLEEETTFSALQQQVEIGSALLPSLSSNIVVGNSLVTLDEESDDMFEVEKLREVKSLNFKHAFPEVFDGGGFDLVIGNPPYIKEYVNRDAFEHVRASKYYQGKMDIWYLFACRGLDWLKAETGVLAFIATNNWVTNAGASKLRSKIVQETVIQKLLDFGSYHVFNKVGIQTMIVILRKSMKPGSYQFDYRRLHGRDLQVTDAQGMLEQDSNSRYEILRPLLKRSQPGTAPLTFASTDRETLLDRIKEQGTFVLDAGKEVAQGIVAPQTHVNRAAQKVLGPDFRIGQGIFVVTEEELGKLHLSAVERCLIRPLYTTDELLKYVVDSVNKLWVIYTDSGFKEESAMDNYPNLKKHLDRFQSVITSGNKPYGLHRARRESFFTGEKVVALRKCTEPTFTYTDIPCYVTQTFNIIKTDRINLKYLTGLLNSRLVQFWLRYRGKMQGENYQVDKEPLLAVPIVASGRRKQVAIAKLVERIVECKQQTPLANTDSEKEQLNRMELQYKRKVDAEVYSLYNLTSAERKLIEDSIVAKR